MALTETDTAASGSLSPYETLRPTLTRRDCFITAIVFGHADADGYVAAEQTRHNLEADGVRVEVVVSKDTRNHRFWHTTFKTVDLRDFNLVVVVDIAFSFKQPNISLDALMERASSLPEKHFVVVDHHPLLKPKCALANVSLIEVESAYDCCLGTPSVELMTLAALCEGELRAQKQATSIQIKRALGLRRAAADIDGVAGQTLLHVLKARAWSFLESLAEEPAEFHRTVRGRRTTGSLPSPTLQSAKLPGALAGSRSPPGR